MLKQLPNPNQAPMWASSGQLPEQEQGHPFLKFLGGVTAIGAAGYIPVGNNKRIWDYYLAGIRNVEEASPAKFLRTFALSETLSPFAGELDTFHIPAEDFTKIVEHEGTQYTTANMAMREYTAKTTGRSLQELSELGVFEKGLTFSRQRGKMFGQLNAPGGQVIARNVLPMNLTGDGASIADWMARINDINLDHQRLNMTQRQVKFFFTAPKIDKVLGIPISEVASDTYHQMNVMRQFARAHAAAQVGRLNKILQAPADWIPGSKKLMSAVGIESLAVKEGTALSMLGRYTKLGLAVGGGFYAFKKLSYERAVSDNRIASTLKFGAIGATLGSLFSKFKGKGKLLGLGTAIGGGIGAMIGLLPIFDKGIIQGGANIWTKGMVGTSYLSQGLGLTEAARRQEELMPGITKFQTLFGFLGAGAFTGGMLGYMARVKRYSTHGIEATRQFLQEQESRIATRTGLYKAGSGFTNWAKQHLTHLSGAGAEGGMTRLMLRGGRFGTLLGGLTYAAAAATAAIATGTFVPGILAMPETPEELKAIYSGEKEIAVRKGRWWEFGRSKWEGNKIDHYRPHWYALMQSRAREHGTWGSETERWAQSPWLHPLKALFDPSFQYRWEMQHYYDRPYPQTGTYGSSIPFITPITESIGQLIKPTRLMHATEWVKGGIDKQFKYVPTAGSNEPAYDLGGIPAQAPVSRYGFQQQLGEQIYRLNEMRGLTGFVHGAIKEAITGSQDYFDQSTQLASASDATGLQRRYWQLELGGLMGSTEALRRFVPHRRNQIEQYNPIRNTMPSWMPGPEYYIDFLHGDPFTKIAEGEIRLPGRGYEALHPELRGMAPEQYPLIHKYKILADVAMYSEQFKYVKEQTAVALEKGWLTEEQINQIRRINTQISEKKKRRTFSEYRFTEGGPVATRVTLAQRKAGTNLFETEEGGLVGLGGIEINANKNTINYRRMQHIVSDFIRENGGDPLDIYVHRDPMHRYKKSAKGTYMEAYIPGLTDKLVDAGIATYKEDSPLNLNAQFNPVQRAVGSMWESITHKESPLEYLTPFSPQIKFIHQRSAIEEYERTRVWGTESAFWQNPYENFIRPFMQMSARTMGSDTIPEHVQQRWATEEYFDKLAWLKSQRLEEQARKQGNVQAAEFYAEQKQRTAFGVNPYGNPAKIYSALPALDRDYAQAFSEASSPEDRQRILNIVPLNQRPIYQAQWDRKASLAWRSGDKSIASMSDGMDQIEMRRYAEGQPINEEMLSQYRSSASPGVSYADWAREKVLADYFSGNPLPRPNWVGFHPHADLDDVKLQYVESAGQDIHDYNLWENRRRLLKRKPYLSNLNQPITPDRGDILTRMLKQTMKTGDIRSLETVNLANNETVIQIRDSRRNVLERYKQDPEFTEMM